MAGVRRRFSSGCTKREDGKEDEAGRFAANAVWPATINPNKILALAQKKQLAPKDLNLD